MTQNRNYPKKPEPETYSVIVADDERPMADLLAINLRRLGHRVLGMAANGREAVKLVLKTQPDIVIMDIDMPILDGLHAAGEILATRRIPIVLSTGHSDAGSIDRAANLHLVSYLVKPFSPAQLKVAICLAVAASRAFVIPECVNT